MDWFSPVALIHYLLVLYVLVRVILRPYREPSSRIAWMLVVLTVPVVGLVLYFLLGETNIGFKRAQKMRMVRAQTFDVSLEPTEVNTAFGLIPEPYRHIFRMGYSVNGFVPIAGNQADLPNDSDAVVEAMVRDMDQAKTQIHVVFYIWLADHNGLKVKEALIRAAQRGIKCRVLIDALGSRAFIHSHHWADLQEGQVELAIALPVGNPLLRMLLGRVDLRNHRKIVVIDQDVTYCGSQNCADPAFAIKAKYAPWVDVMARFTGPIVWQNQRLFASDWLAATHETLDELGVDMSTTLQGHGGIVAQVVGTGPTERYSAMSDVFLKAILCAQKRLTICTPYFVPNEPIFAALCAAARTGIHVTMVFPRRNDSWVVSAASRSYYRELLEAGVRIYEYNGGLLHAKLLTLDDCFTLIGSANMDRRSFDLNYENNILAYDQGFTQTISKRQQQFIDSSTPVGLDEVKQWSKTKQLWNNTIAILGPVL